MLEIELGIDFFEFLVEHAFAAVSERSVADIMAQCDRPYEVNVEAQCLTDGSGDVVNIENVLQT